MSNQYLGDDRIVHESIDVSKASSRRIYSNSEAPDDIVTRLREQIPIPLEVADEGAPAHLIAEAADEIERLRLQVKEWRQIADVCVMAIGVPENETDKLAVRLYDKAVRSE